MEEKMACTGVLVDLKHMKMSGRLRVSIEIEPEMSNAAFERLGGWPVPGESRLVALAVMGKPDV